MNYSKANGTRLPDRGGNIAVVAAFAAAMVTPVTEAAQQLQIVSSAFTQDLQFPHYVPFIVDGWDLKHGIRRTVEYAQIVPPAATLHAFVQNSSSEAVEAERVLLNGIDLARHLVPQHGNRRGIPATSYLLNDTAVTPPAVQRRLDDLGAPVWYQVRPNPIPPGGVGQIVVRLRRLPVEKHLVLGLQAGVAQAVSAKLSADQPAALTIASVNCGQQRDRVFLYVRRNDCKDYELASVRLDQTVHDFAQRQRPPRSASGFLPIEVPLDRPWSHGSFHYVAVTTRDGMTAATVVRASDGFFALGMWGYRNHGNTEAERARDTCAAFRDHLFNTHMGMAGGQTGFLESAPGLRLLEQMGLRLMAREPDSENISNPQIYARFLLDEPDVHDNAVDALPGHLRVGSFAQGLIARQHKWTQSDPRHLTLLNVNLTYKPRNWLIYGQLPDILAIDPYYQSRLNDVYWRHPGWLAQYCHPYYVYALSDVARFACEPRPLHVILNSVSVLDGERLFRYGTPEEKRIEFYYALAAGAKGISYWWFTPYGKYMGCGADDPAARAMMQEMKRLNAEARALAPLLATACPANVPGELDPFTSARPQWLMTRTLFAGTHSALIVLVNRDHASDRIGTLYEPIQRGYVTLHVPPWLKPEAAFRVSDAGVQELPITPNDDTVTVQLANLNLAEMLVVTQRPQLAEQVRRRWLQTTGSTSRPANRANE